MQLGLFRGEKREIRVEHQGDSALVDVKKKTCECGKKNCVHKYVAVALYEGQMEFESTSALHKEIRRGDVERALHWGYWVQRNRGVQKLRSYLRNICFEETRNRALHAALRKERDWVTMIQLLCGSTKRWEIQSRSGLEVRIMEAYWRVRATKHFNGILDRAKSETDVDKLFELLQYWLVTDSYGVKKGIVKVLSDRLGVEGIAATNYNGLAFLCEHVGGMLDGTAEKIETADMSSVVDLFGKIVPPFEDYVFDLHTRQGRARLRDSGSKVLPNKPMPAGLDLRWSGAQIGVIWRDLAVTQGFTSLLDVPWEDVVFTPEVWKLTERTSRAWGEWI